MKVFEKIAKVWKLLIIFQYIRIKYSDSQEITRKSFYLLYLFTKLL